MGREIELKLPLTDEQFIKVFNWICGIEKNPKICCKNLELLFKSDEYYSQYDNHEERLANEPRVIRLRTEKKQDDFFNQLKGKSFLEIREWLFQIQDEKSCGSKALFTVKTKKIENGIEFNKEDETEISDADVLRSFFDKTRFNCWFCKRKIAFGVIICAAGEQNASFEENALCSQTVSDSQNASSLQNGSRSGQHASSMQNGSRFGQNLCFHLELELVNSLPYIEIEYTGDDVNPDKVRIELEKLLELLELDKNQKESRSWVEIINENASGASRENNVKGH